MAYAFEGTNNTVTFASASGVSSITTTVKPGAVSDFPFGSSINREYAVSVTASGAYNATLRLHYQDSELNGNTESILELWRNASGWSSSGKTTNDTVNNWVEQSGRTNLIGRWTLSTAASVVAWNGSVSAAWETAANWTAVQGAPSRPPSSNDVVELGVGTFTFPPTISSAAQANQIFFGSTQAIALTIGASGSLTVLGNVVGTWGQNATHTINVGSQTLTVGGSLNLSDGTNGHAINLNIGSGSVALGGSLTESGGANITFSGAGTLGIGGDFNYVSGTFTPGSGKLTYNGSAAQAVAGVTYYRLNIDKPAGTATLLSSATVNSDLTVTNVGTLQVSVPLVVAGNVTIESNATFIASSATTTISVGGDWTRRGTFIPGLTTVLFNGSGGQTISEGTFGHFDLNKPSGTATLAGNVLVNLDVEVFSGTLNLATFAINASAPGAFLALAAGTTLRTADSFPTTFGTLSLDPTSTVEYYGSGSQTVGAATYGHLILTNGGSNAKTLAGASFVAGDLTIKSNTTFNGSSYLIALSGNWTNQGTFQAANSTLKLEGSGKIISGNNTFSNLTVVGSYTVTGTNLYLTGNLITSGSLDGGTATVTLDGDLLNTGTLTASGTTTFTGTRVQTLQLLGALVSASTGVINFNGTVAPVLSSTTAPQFVTVNINNTAGIAPSIGWTVFGGFIVSPGATFTGGSPTHTFYGPVLNYGTLIAHSGAMNNDKLNRLSALQGAIWKTINPTYNVAATNGNAGFNAAVTNYYNTYRGANYATNLTGYGTVHSGITFISETGKYGKNSAHQSFAIAGVPEPGTWLVMILGFGLTGAMLRRSLERPVLATVSAAI